MLGVFAVETNLRRERQLEGIAKAKAAGVYKGRPPSIEASRVRELKGRGVRPVDIAKVSRVTNASPSPREGRLLAQSVSRAALQQAIIKRQGLIAEQGYEQQAQSYLNMSAAADMAASAGERSGYRCGLPVCCGCGESVHRRLARCAIARTGCLLRRRHCWRRRAPYYRTAWAGVTLRLCLRR
jgi:hypothetical protein